MKVAELQSFLNSLVTPLVASGAKKAADDLSRAGAALDPFQEWTVPQWADFLAQAEEYARTGVVPTSGKGKRGTTGRRSVAVDAARIEESARHIRELYESATGEAVTYAGIDTEVNRLGKQLSKDEAVQVAAAFGINGAVKTKKAALEAIRQKIVERKQSFQRTQF